MDKKAAAAVVFENPEFGKIRTLTDENGEPLFRDYPLLHQQVSQRGC